LVFSDLLLARRLEAAEAANARGCTSIHPEAASLEVFHRFLATRSFAKITG